MCRRRGLVPMEPLFGSSTESLFVEWIVSGGDATIITTRASQLDRSWLGRRLSLEMLDDFKRLGVDPCGERGEYHTVVTNCPLFRSPLTLTLGEAVQVADCWALDAMTTAAATGL